jgi:hypothetical protein
MRKHIFFLKCSSVAIKVAAWIILLLGIVGAVSLFLGTSQGNSRWMGFVILVFYLFAFWVLFLIAKIADIVVKLIDAVQKD